MEFTPKTILIAVVIIAAIVFAFSLRSCKIKQQGDEGKSKISFELEKNKER